MKCGFTKENGLKCEANALRGGDFCFLHSDDPEIVKVREKALSEGGKNSRKQYEPLLDEIAVCGAKDVVELIVKLIGEVRRDEISTKKASTIGFLLNTLLKALELGEIDDKLEAVKSIFSGRGIKTK